MTVPLVVNASLPKQETLSVINEVIEAKKKEKKRRVEIGDFFSPTGLGQFPAHGPSALIVRVKPPQPCGLHAELHSGSGERSTEFQFLKPASGVLLENNQGRRSVSKQCRRGWRPARVRSKVVARSRKKHTGSVT